VNPQQTELCNNADENGEFQAEREEVLRAATVTKMLQTLPWDVRRKVAEALKKRDKLTAAKIVYDHWDGAQWSSVSLESNKVAAKRRLDLQTVQLIIRTLDLS
jgi:hypothetical protein